MPDPIRIEFPGTDFGSLRLESGTLLSEELTAMNSPILFGCRSGICGTCLVEAGGTLPPAEIEEAEALEVFAPGHPNARLACQLRPVSDIRLRRIESC